MLNKTYFTFTFTLYSRSKIHVQSNNFVPEKRTLLRKLIRYGVDLSLEEIESLAPISETYIVPFNHTTTKPFAFVCYTTEDRPGSIEEAQTFMRALKQLGLSVYANCWGNIRELERGLSEKLEEVKHECSFLLLAIMSHGFTGHILGEDGSRGKLNTLISIVDNNLRKTVPIVSIQLLSSFVKSSVQ